MFTSFKELEAYVLGCGMKKRIALANKETLVCAGELVMDVGTMLDGKKAVKEKLIDQLGGISDALEWLYREIERTE